MEYFLFAEYIGIASAALSGFLFGIKKRCDWLGVFVAAFLTALGGGIIRDITVSRPPYSFTNYAPVLIVLGVMGLAILLHWHQKISYFEGKFFFIFTDAIDVVSFSIVGAMVTIEYGYNIFGVIMVAFANGVGGGILRDVLLKEVPWFFRTGLYGTISMGVGLLYFIMDYLEIVNIFSIMTLLIFGVLFRMLAFYKKWHLPDVGYKN